MAGNGTGYPVTLVWPAGAQIATIGGQWRRLETGEVEATYASQEELAWALTFRDVCHSESTAEPEETQIPLEELAVQRLAGPERPECPCGACGSTRWWRPPTWTNIKGWLCSTCHPCFNPLWSQVDSDQE